MGKVKNEMCESAKCGFNPKHSLTEADKTELRDIRKHILNIVNTLDQLVLADAERSTIITFLSRQLELVVGNMTR